MNIFTTRDGINIFLFLISLQLNLWRTRIFLMRIFPLLILFLAKFLYVCINLYIYENSNNSKIYNLAFLWMLQQDCPNGRLTPAKFVDMYKMFFPSGNAEEFCDHVFRTFDMDKNGYIDFKVSSSIFLQHFEIAQAAVMNRVMTLPGFRGTTDFPKIRRATVLVARRLFRVIKHDCRQQNWRGWLIRRNATILSSRSRFYVEISLTQNLSGCRKSAKIRKIYRKYIIWVAKRKT